jgi:hypothetical protein
MRVARRERIGDDTIQAPQDAIRDGACRLLQAEVLWNGGRKRQHPAQHGGSERGWSFMHATVQNSRYVHNRLRRSPPVLREIESAAHRASAKSAINNSKIAGPAIISW